MVKRRKQTVFEISRSERLKRILYKAAIKGLITLVFMAAAYTWFMDRTTEIINKRIEKYQSPSSNKDADLSIESEEVEIRETVEAEQKLERFKAQYKKPEKCYNVTDNETRVYCANDYIRARKAFESAAN